MSMLEKENEAPGKKCAYSEEKRKKRELTFIWCYPCQTLTAQWEQDEQGKSLFQKEYSKEGVYINNYNTNLKVLSTITFPLLKDWELSKGIVKFQQVRSKIVHEKWVFKINWLVLDMWEQETFQA